MSQEELLAKVAAVLEAAGVPYIVTGSVASALYGEPRFTQDADVVVIAPPGLGAELAAALPSARYYADARDVEESLRKGLICNLIDLETARKVDFHPLKPEPFELSFFNRRRKVVYSGVEVWFPSAEEAILSKLVWARVTGDGEKHLYDASRVYRLQYERLDLGYIDEWAAKLHLSDLLERVKEGISGESGS
jgi:hypothetical protein